jgi:insulysin
MADVMFRLFTGLITDALSSAVYAASLAGLYFNIDPLKEGVHVGVGGFNDKLLVLLRTVLDALVYSHAGLNERKLSVIKEEVRHQVYTGRKVLRFVSHS